MLWQKSRRAARYAQFASAFTYEGVKKQASARYFFAHSHLSTRSTEELALSIALFALALPFVLALAPPTQIPTFGNISGRVYLAPVHAASTAGGYA